MCVEGVHWESVWRECTVCVEGVHCESVWREVHCESSS